MIYHRIEGGRAAYMAKKIRPTVYCEIRRATDLPVEIPVPKNDVMPVMLNGEVIGWDARPTAYYWCMTDEVYYFVGYAFYHVMDYTDCPPGKLVGGQHYHDLEGAMIRVPYSLPHSKFRWPRDICAVHHKGFERVMGLDEEAVYSVDIKAGSHAISLTPTDGVVLSGMLLKPFSTLEKHYEIIEKVFNDHGVNMPWRWSDHGEHEGAFWNDPARLFVEVK